MMNNNLNIDDMVIEKELGHGMIGTRYLVHHNVTQEKFADDNHKYDLSKREWRDIDFSINFCKQISR